MVVTAPPLRTVLPPAPTNSDASGVVFPTGPASVRVPPPLTVSDSLLSVPFTVEPNVKLVVPFSCRLVLTDRVTAPVKAAVVSPGISPLVATWIGCTARFKFTGSEYVPPYSQIVPFNSTWFTAGCSVAKALKPNTSPPIGSFAGSAPTVVPAQLSSTYTTGAVSTTVTPFDVAVLCKLAPSVARTVT